MTQAFNLSQLANNLNTSGQLDATDGLTGAVPVANGGTGSSSLTANNVLLGNGTSAIQTVAPGTSGNVLLSNGTTWTSGAVAAWIGSRGQAFTSNGTFTIPAGITALKIIVVGGGGAGASANSGSPGSATAASGGGGGATAISYLTGLTSGATLNITVGGAGGNSTVASGTQTITTITGGGGNSAGTGGTATNGTVNFRGENAQPAYTFPDIAGVSAFGGKGGSSLYGQGGNGGVYVFSTFNIGVAGTAGFAYGGGGGGAVAINSGGTYGGGAGTAGIVIIEW